MADLREEAEHMAKLVNELLVFSKAGMQREQANLERRVRVAEIVERVVSREATAGVAVEVRVPDELAVAADPEYLFRALANIVRNAIRYAGQAGPIEISARQERGVVRIVVADQGPGIPEEELENVFRPFYRPEFARTRETGGTGLGLAIVRDSIEACGGRVVGRNRGPQGLEVVVELNGG